MLCTNIPNSKKEMHPLKALFQTSIIPALTYKKGALAIMSLPFAVLLDAFYSAQFLGLNVTFLFLFLVLIIFDLVTGIVASRHVGEQIQSTKLVYTFYKVLMYFLFFWTVSEIQRIVPVGDSFIYQQAQHVLGFTRGFIFIILTLREYISVGENIEKRFGKKPYIFTLTEKLAELIEAKVVRKIEDSNICEK
jgi:hypothetical protein